MSVFLPFAQTILEFPQSGETWVSLGLNEIPDNVWKPILLNIQPWRSDFLNLKQSGFNCLPILPENFQQCDGGLLQLGKHKGLNQNRFIDLLLSVKTGGTIIIAGEKNLGVQSMFKWINNIVPIDGKLSKNHGSVFWLKAPEQLDTALIASLRIKQEIFDDKFSTEVGMFSHGRVDSGSVMLTNYLRKVVFGKTADFGAGWGYLSCEAITLSEKITHLDLYEADYRALQAAENNLGSLNKDIPIQYFWHDITKEPISEIYDTIISNPPFHEGRAADVSLGQKFIEVAAQRLKPGGCLLMVANRQLPYEASLNKLFRKILVLEEQNGFKVFEARK